ncbi:MAG: caspase family protein [Bacteroidota bacterium]
MESVSYSTVYYLRILIVFFLSIMLINCKAEKTLFSDGKMEIFLDNSWSVENKNFFMNRYRKYADSLNLRGISFSNNNADYLISQYGNRFQLESNSGDVLWEIDDSEGYASLILLEKLKYLSEGLNLKNVVNENREFEVHFEINSPVLGQLSKEHLESNIINRQALENSSLRIYNRGKNPFYFTIIHIDPRGKIQMIAPSKNNRIIGKERFLYPKEYSSFLDISNLSIGFSGEQSLMLIASETPLNFDLYLSGHGFNHDKDIDLLFSNEEIVGIEKLDFELRFDMNQLISEPQFNAAYKVSAKLPGENDWNAYTNILYYNFKDSDGDGIIDSDDLFPNIAGFPAEYAIEDEYLKNYSYKLYSKALTIEDYEHFWMEIQKIQDSVLPNKDEKETEEEVATKNGLVPTTKEQSEDKSRDNVQKILEQIRALPSQEIKIIMESLKEERERDSKYTYKAIIIANQNYPSKSGFSSLSHPIADADKMVDVLKSKFGFKDDDITYIKNANGEEMHMAFKNQIDSLSNKNHLLVFYAGHGEYVSKLKKGYWIPVDAIKGKERTYFQNGDIKDFVSNYKAKHILLIIDSCFAGSFFQENRGAIATNKQGGHKEKAKEVINRYNRKKVRVAMTSGSDRPVPDRSEFIKNLLETLQDMESEYMMGSNLFAEIKEAVDNNTENIPQFRPIRNTGHQTGDFIFVKKN